MPPTTKATTFDLLNVKAPLRISGCQDHAGPDADSSGHAMRLITDNFQTVPVLLVRPALFHLPP